METINYTHQGGLQTMNVCSASKDIYNFKAPGTFSLDEGQELTNVETQREAQEVGQCQSQVCRALNRPRSPKW